ncbi:MAG: hypothetical protein IKM04_07955 [Clostridia bacterium]|nr:hypothetical protein [Clostridia bacterium]
MNMRRAFFMLLALALGLSATGCSSDRPALQTTAGSSLQGTSASHETTAVPTGEPFVYPDDDKDFSAFTSPSEQEAAYDYETFVLPEPDNGVQPYVGDPMPYYEDGVFYIYYLKDGGDSHNHSVYLLTTRDFVSYEEHDGPILESDRNGGQDDWIGTGSVVKVGQKYYLFYTGHNGSGAMEYNEKIMVAVGDSLTSFEKLAGWEIVPDPSLGQKTDFRDPQAYYDPDTGIITLTVTASMQGTARILRYSLNADLSGAVYEGILYSNRSGSFWNLECSDTFRIGDRWYLTYSAQDDTLWFSSADSQYGEYTKARRFEGRLFYAAKHVEDENGSYMVGWARRSSDPSSSEVTAWAGNLVVQKIVRKENGHLTLEPVGAVADSYDKRRELLLSEDSISLEGSAEVFNCYESFKLTGKFVCPESGRFGLSFDCGGSAEGCKRVEVDLDYQMLHLLFDGGSTSVTWVNTDLEPGKSYGFTYIQEGSVGCFYIDGEAAMTVRLYGVSGRPVSLYAEGCVAELTELRQYTR